MVQKLCFQLKSGTQHIYRNNHLCFQVHNNQQEYGICYTSDLSVKKFK